jgi:hypothetical protein
VAKTSLLSALAVPSAGLVIRQVQSQAPVDGRAARCWIILEYGAYSRLASTFVLGLQCHSSFSIGERQDQKSIDPSYKSAAFRGNTQFAQGQDRRCRLAIFAVALSVKPEAKPYLSAVSYAALSDFWSLGVRIRSPCRPKHAGMDRSSFRELIGLSQAAGTVPE